MTLKERTQALSKIEGRLRTRESQLNLRLASLLRSNVQTLQEALARKDAVKQIRDSLAHVHDEMGPVTTELSSLRQRSSKLSMRRSA